MTAIAPYHTSFSPAQLQIIKKAVAPDTNDIEFDLFIETCRLYGLNPMKRQIGARVYSKDSADKRKMAIITEIAGLRSIAARHGDYLPDDDEPEFSYDEVAKNPQTNPLGLVRAKVSAYRIINGVKHRVVGVAYWDEFAPVEREWKWGPGRGQKVYSGLSKLGDNWLKMPRLMLAKCAEAQALRKGWPEDLSGLYESAEVEKEYVDLTATEALDQAAADDRMRKLGSPKHGYAIQWDIGAPLETVASGKMFDRVSAFATAADTHLLKLRQFREVNAESFNRYWADSRNDALDLKRMLDTVEQRLKEAEGAQ